MKKALGLDNANDDDTESQNTENQFDDNNYDKRGGRDNKK